MAEFGMPQRTATQDANDGNINPPAKTYATRGATTKRTKELSASDQFAAQAGQDLGNALAGMLTEEANNINEQRVIQAQARQGVDGAINSVDKVKKRTGWESMVFGENIEYRAAQQRAVENKVQASYLEDLAGVDGFAGDTPEQYNTRLTKKNDEILSQYDDDRDTKNKVAAALAVSTKKLSGAHYKSHYAYNQLQQQETTRTRVMQTIDGFNLERTAEIDPSEGSARMTEVNDFFKGKMKPDGMTKEAYRAMQLEAIQTHMSKGNMGALKAAQASGFDKGLSAREQAMWDGALDKYDTQFGQKADLIRTQADISIANARTPQQVTAAVNAKNKQLDELFKGSSGTMKSQSIIARGNLDIAQDKKSVYNQQVAMQKAAQAAAKKAVSDSDKNILMMIEIQRENMNQAIDLAGDDAAARQAAVNDYYTQMGELGQGLSPSLANVLKQERLETSASKAQQSLDKERIKTQNAADEKTAELAVQAAKDEAISEYFQTNDPVRKAAIQHEQGLTTKEKKEGFDTHLLASSQKFVGGEEVPTVQEFGKALQSNPELQEYVKQELARTGVASPMLQTLIQTTVNGSDNLYDEDGNVTEVGLSTVAMVDKMLETEQGIVLAGGKSAARNWRMISRGVHAGQGQQATEKKLTDFTANKQRIDAAGFSWKPVIGDQTGQQFMKNKLRQAGIQNPSSQLVATKLADYKDNLIAFGGDKNEADNAFFTEMNNKTKVFNSVMSEDSAYLNEVTDYSAEDLVTNADKYGLLVGKYGDLTGNRVSIKSHTEVANIKWYTKPGVAGMFASSPSSNNEMFISVDEMQDMEEYIKQQDIIKKETDKRRAKIGTAAIMDSRLYK